MKKKLFLVIMLFVMYKGYSMCTVFLANKNVYEFKYYGDITLKLYNKSNKKIQIKYEKKRGVLPLIVETINAKCTIKISLAQGARVFNNDGVILLTIKPDLDGTEQIIAK